MWQNGNMYGGFYDRRYTYSTAGGGNNMIMAQPNSVYGQLYNQLYPNNNYNPRRLQPVQRQASPQPKPQEYRQPSDVSQIRRLSRPADESAAYPAPDIYDAVNSSESSFSDAKLPAIVAGGNGQPNTYASQSQKRYSSSQPYTLPRNLSMFNGNQNGVSAYGTPTPNSMRPQTQPQHLQPLPHPGRSQVSMQSHGSFRRSSSGLGGSALDAVSLRRIGSGFDSRPNNSFRAAGSLDRQFSDLGEDMGFYKYTPQMGTSVSSGTEGYNNSGKGSNLQRDSAGSSSLYRMYSFSEANHGGALNRGISGYGSMYGGQNLYGGSGNIRGGTSFYGTMSSANLQPSYSFAGSAIQGYGSGFALLDSAVEENEFGGGPSTATESWSASNGAEGAIPTSKEASPQPSVTPPLRTSGSSRRPRSHSAPASRPSSQRSAPASSSPIVEKTESGRRRRQRPPKRTSSEDKKPQVVTTEVREVDAPPPPPPPPLEDVLVPIKRRASAPVNATRSAPTPFEQMRALRRVQTSGCAASPPSPQPAALSSTIGRRRGTNGGLMFSGAAVV